MEVSPVEAHGRQQGREVGVPGIQGGKSSKELSSSH